MKKAVIYARYSSERQTEQSIEGQLRECNRYAAAHDILIVDTYIDRAMTGTNDKRTDFQRMLRDSNKRAWEFVIVYKIDRFGRNKYELAMNKHTLKNNGVKLISAMENIPDSPEGIILESLLEGMAEYYSAELSQKVKRGMNETRLKGNYTGGYIPYGFKKDGKRIVEDENEAKIVVWIYEQYAKGVYVKDIIAQLNDKGLTLRGRTFAKNTVHRILQSEKYSGQYTLRGDVYTNLYPKIVPDELFNKVQLKNRQNQYGCHSQTTTYLLRKKLYCGYCGNTINGRSGTSKMGVKKYYYACSGVYLKKGCKKQTLRKEDLEDVVIQALMTAFEKDGALDALADRILAINKQRLEDTSIYNLLLKEQKEVQTRLHNIMQAIETGTIQLSGSVSDRLKELDERNGELREKIEIEKSKNKLTVTKTDIMEFLKKALNNDPARIIDLLVKKIVLFDDKIEIICNYTDNKGPDSGLDFLFCSTEGFVKKFVPENLATESVRLEVGLYV